MCSALSFSPSTSMPAGRVPLIGDVTERRAAASEEELGRGGDDRPAGADERPGLEWVERCESRGETGRVAGERRGEVLHEVCLVEVAASDGGANLLDRARVALVVPGALPVAHLEAAR